MKPTEAQIQQVEELVDEIEARLLSFPATESDIVQIDQQLAEVIASLEGKRFFKRLGSAQAGLDKQAYSMAMPEPGSCYAVTTPINFYEWRYSGIIPKGTKCSKLLPPSDVIAYDDERVVVSFVANEQQISDKSDLTEDVYTPVVLRVGQIQNPTEIMDRYQNLVEESRRKFEDFKITCIAQEYVISRQDQPRLYRITPQSKSEVSLEYFGALRDISQHVTELRSLLSERAHTKEGRAYELANLRKIENIYTYMGNVGVPIDATKFQILIEESNVQPQQTTKSSWEECYLSLVPEAKDMYDKIQHFQSLNWVKAITAQQSSESL